MEAYIVKIQDISNELIEKMSPFLSSDRKRKINNFLKKEDKIRSFVSEILIRYIIMKNLNLNNSEIDFYTNKYGKVYLKKYTGFHFNLSHSHSYVVCTFDINEIGIDIEKIISIDYKEISQHYFSKNELNYIFDENIKKPLSKFYEIWTLKESYVKYCGKGLYIPLNSFSINIDINGVIKIDDINSINNIANLKLFDIDPDYKMSICSSSNKTSYTIKKISQELLFSSFLDLSSSET